MFFEEMITEEEAISFIQESIDDSKNQILREQLIDPIIQVLEKPVNRNKYIQYGSEFLEANATMLAKEYPTKYVVFPRKYVDRIIELFGFTKESLNQSINNILKQIRDKGEFKVLKSTPTNFIHCIVLFYSDMILNRQLRDSARQQLGLTTYAIVMRRFFKNFEPPESIMAYTYMHLDNSWALVREGNVINWISSMVDSSYGFWRSKLSLDMSPNTLVSCLSRIRSGMQQSMRSLSNRFYADQEEGNEIGADIKSDDSEEHVVTSNTVTIRNNIMRLIKTGDVTYKSMNKLYEGIAKRKNVRVSVLYEFAQKIDHKDISQIIDLLFYIFIVKEGNTIEDINSTKYIGRITNFPTAIDRAIPGKPVILPLSRQYNYDASIIKAYICFVATYILAKINDVKRDQY